MDVDFIKFHLGCNCIQKSEPFFFEIYWKKIAQIARNVFDFETWLN